MCWVGELCKDMCLKDWEKASRGSNGVREHQGSAEGKIKKELSLDWREGAKEDGGPVKEIDVKMVGCQKDGRGAKY